MRIGGTRGVGVFMGASGGNLQAFSFLGRSRRVFFFRPKTRFAIFVKSVDLYKLLAVLGAPAGAFFPQNRRLLIFGEVLGSVYVIK